MAFAVVNYADTTMNTIQLAPEQEPSTAHVDPIYWDVFIRGALQPILVRSRRWYDAMQTVMTFYGTSARFFSAHIELRPSSPCQRGKILVTLEATR